MAHGEPSAVERAVTLVVVGLLTLALAVGLAPNVSARAVQLGSSIWPGYGADLRVDPPLPTCALDELRARADRCVEPAPAADSAAEAVDPFAEPAPAVDPFADPFAEPSPAADPFAEPAPAVEPAPAADPFAEPSGASVSCAAVRALATRCADRWDEHQDIAGRITPGVRAYRAVENWIGSFARFPFLKHLLALVVLAGAAGASWRGSHIALREPQTLAEARVADGAQLLAHLAWLLSCLADARVQALSSAESDQRGLPLLWATGFAALALIHVRNLRNLLHRWSDGAGGALTARALLVVPLYTWMALLGAVWFAAEGHPSGPAIHLHKFTQIPTVYLGIALYIWSGMLLSRTTLASRVFDLLTPWGLPAPLLGWVVVVLAALPTAYSGASGIFVIAAGAVIFERLVAAGAAPRVALTATVMSGALGVVLRPCLVVVLVAVLNNNVTTDELFGWGRWVFALTATLFLVAMVARVRGQVRPRPLPDAGAQALTALRGLSGHVLVALVVLLFYGTVLGTAVDEHTAAWVLPGVLLAVAAWDRLGVGGLWSRVVDASAESSHHAGALLLLMAGSVAVGGVVERSELLSAVPTDFGSPILAMVFLVVVLVLVGMTMDALGAVILVSVTLAQVADANGIQPVHFWMVVLCAFELGYLTPPVALNHLLARQAIGPEADVVGLPAASVFERYEHVLIPVVVMGCALGIVAFGPLLLA